MNKDRIEDIFEVLKWLKQSTIGIEKLLVDSVGCKFFMEEDLKYLQTLSAHMSQGFFEDEKMMDSWAWQRLQNAIHYAQLLTGGDTRSENVEGLKVALESVSLALQSKFVDVRDRIDALLDEVSLCIPYHYRRGA